MNKSGLIAEVRTGASKADIGRMIDSSMDVIRESVSRGERVSLVGFRPSASAGTRGSRGTHASR